MSTLRERLSEDSPDLHAALERNWRIAREEWLPAIATSSDSYNSYPHLRNLEEHLQQLMEAFEASSQGKRKLILQPVEIYVLLASILFHDLGRIIHIEKHADWSKKLIRNNYGNLGIPSRELAVCIANICEGHDPPKGWTKGRLYTTVIEPHGEVRLRALWALLVLVDHMDGAYRRTLPDYIKHSGQLEIKGMFRNCIRGIYANCSTQIVKIVLADMQSSMRKSKGATKGEVNYRFSDDKNKRRELKITKRDSKKTDIQQIRDLLNEEKRIPNVQRLLKIVSALPKKCLIPPLWQLLPNQKIQTFDTAINIPRTRKFGVLDWCVVEGLLYAEPKPSIKKQSDASLWPNRGILSILMHDAKKNFSTLSEIKEDLAILGIPLQAWLLEHREHLYNCYGFETYEAIFNQNFLHKIAEGMWNLSLQIFGYSKFTYAELASQVWEPQVDKVKGAVKRLSIVMRNQASRIQKNAPPGNNDMEVIWAGEESWSWNQRQIGLNQVQKYISALHYPVS